MINCELPTRVFRSDCILEVFKRLLFNLIKEFKDRRVRNDPTTCIDMPIEEERTGDLCILLSNVISLIDRRWYQHEVEVAIEIIFE